MNFLNFDKICRICKTENIEMCSIFSISQISETSKYSDLVMACASVQIEINDGLPTLICLQCVDDLSLAYNFKLKCEDTDKSLRLCLEEQSIKLEDNLNYDDCALNDFNNFENNVKEEVEEKKVPIRSGKRAKRVSRQRLDDMSMQKKIYACKICKKSFTRYGHLKTHMIVHLKVKPHMCRICKRGFNVAENLFKHERKCKGQRSQFICEICDRSFVRLPSLKVHMEGHDERQGVLDSMKDIDSYIDVSGGAIVQTVTKPNLADVDFKTEIIEENMDFSHHNENGFEDEIDENRDLKSLSKKLRKIEKNKTNKENNSKEVKRRRKKRKNLQYAPHEFKYFCTENGCDKGFVSQIELDIHKQIHTNPKNVFKCWHCEKIFKRGDHLKDHIQYVHLDIRPFTCNLCMNGFKRKIHLENHMNTVHAIKIRFQCDMCILEFPKMEQLEKHKSIKHGIGEPIAPLERKFKCGVCNKGFTKEKFRHLHTLKAHLARKVCKVCQVEFKTKEELQKHLKESEDCAKRFLCSECGKGFAYKYSLDTHVRRHRGEKPFKCNYCEKGFAALADLNNHEKYHTGGMQHICPECGKAYISPNKLIAHMRKHTGEKPFKCNQCSTAFARKNNLNKHIKRHITGTFEKRVPTLKPRKRMSNKKKLLAPGVQISDQPPPATFLVPIEIGPL